MQANQLQGEDSIGLRHAAPVMHHYIAIHVSLSDKLSILIG